MPTTTDANDPRLGHGLDTEPKPQNEVYLVLSENERAKGFVRPVRLSYIHVGAPAPQHPLLDLTDEQKETFGDEFAKFEKYPEGQSAVGRYWRQAELDNAEKGCRAVTTMGRAIAETYARNPHFYGYTYCAHCQKHLSVKEFVWVDDGTIVGS